MLPVPPTEKFFEARTSNVLRPGCRSELCPSQGATVEPPVPFVPFVKVAPVAAPRLPVMRGVSGSPLSSVRMPLNPRPQRLAG